MDIELADVVFMVGEDQEEIRSHRVFLKAHSEYFEKMLNSSFHEGGPGARILVPEVSPRAFRAMLAYLYTNSLDVDDDIVIEVAQLADQYLLIDLTEQCVGYCNLHIHVTNVTLWLVQSDRHGLANMRATCLDY